MSEEIAQAAGDIAYWRRRAEQAEAGAAALRQAAVGLMNAAADPRTFTRMNDLGIFQEAAALRQLAISPNPGAALLAELTRRAEQAEADVLALNNACDRMAGVVRGLMYTQDDVCPLCHARISSFGDRHAADCPMVLAAARPGASLMAELEAARAFIRAIRSDMFGGFSDEQGALLDAYDAAVKASQA